MPDPEVLILVVGGVVAGIYIVAKAKGVIYPLNPKDAPDTIAGTENIKIEGNEKRFNPNKE